MPATSVMSGARARCAFVNGSQLNFIGIYSDCSYGVSYDVEPVYILGRYSAAASEYTSASIIQLSCSGWRAINSGFYSATGGNMPKLQELISAGYMTFVIHDRQTDKEIARIEKVRPASGSVGFSMRQLSSGTYTYVGIMASDESGPVGESPNAMDLPPA